MLQTYAVNDIFYSIQGEGVRTGTANLFLRLSGCNLQCDIEAGSLSPGGFRCDTEFVSSRRMTLARILERFKALSASCEWVILTGGEPTLQIDQEMIDGLREAGYYIAIETNGTTDISSYLLDWVCVSPKTAEHTLQQLTAHEVKYVRNYGQGIPKPRIQSEHYLISPAFDGDMVHPETLQWCIQLCKDHPQWRLSIQLHKWINVR